MLCIEKTKKIKSIEELSSLILDPEVRIQLLLELQHIIILHLDDLGLALLTWKIREYLYSKRRVKSSLWGHFGSRLFLISGILFKFHNLKLLLILNFKKPFQVIDFIVFVIFMFEDLKTV